jgi:hypothetical protein
MRPSFSPLLKGLDNHGILFLNWVVNHGTGVAAHIYNPILSGSGMWRLQFKDKVSKIPCQPIPGGHHSQACAYLSRYTGIINRRIMV